MGRALIGTQEHASELLVALELATPWTSLLRDPISSFHRACKEASKAEWVACRTHLHLLRTPVIPALSAIMCIQRPGRSAIRSHVRVSLRTMISRILTSSQETEQRQINYTHCDPAKTSVSE